MESGLNLRDMRPADREIWADMYAALFPEAARAQCLAEIDRILSDPRSFAFVAERGGQAQGFAEVSLRPHANGCASKPVPFLEGIWVRPDARHAGVATQLLAHVEEALRARGFQELGSNVLQGNDAGAGFHAASGFEATERVIYYRKTL